MADQARLEIVCARKRTVGSNPTLSAISSPLQDGPWLRLIQLVEHAVCATLLLDDLGRQLGRAA